MRIQYFIVLFLVSLISFEVSASYYQWNGNGASPSDWSVVSNWQLVSAIPNGTVTGIPTVAPGSSDYVYFKLNTGNQDVVINNDATVAGLVIESGNIDITTHILTVTGAITCSGGKISNGSVNVTGSGATHTFSGGATFESDLSVKGLDIYLNGANFYGTKTSFEKISTGTLNTSNGGNHFGKIVSGNIVSTVLIKNSNSTAFTLGNVSPDIFDCNLVLLANYGAINIGSNSLNNLLNGNVYCNAVLGVGIGVGAITFGTNTAAMSGASTLLADGKIIKIGTDDANVFEITGGMPVGTLSFTRFIQQGTTAQTLTLGVSTSTSTVNFNTGSVFNGNLTITAPNFNLNGASFYGISSFTKTGGVKNASDGGNYFDKEVLIQHLVKAGSTSSNIMAFKNADIFNKDLYLVIDAINLLQIAHTYNTLTTNEFRGNIYINGTSSTVGGVVICWNGGIATQAIDKVIKTGVTGVGCPFAITTGPVDGPIGIGNITQASSGTIPDLSNDIGGGSKQAIVSQATLYGKLNINGGNVRVFNSTIWGDIIATKTSAATSADTWNNNKVKGKCTITNSSIYGFNCGSFTDVYTGAFSYTQSSPTATATATAVIKFAAGTKFDNIVSVTNTNTNVTCNVNFTGAVGSPIVALGPVTISNVKGSTVFTYVTQGVTGANNAVNSVSNSNTGKVTFGAGNIFNDKVNVTSGDFVLNGTSFYGISSFIKTGGVASGSASVGNNYFDKAVLIKNSVPSAGNATYHILLANAASSPDIFNDDLYIVEDGISSIYVSNLSNTTFNGNIYLNSTSNASNANSIIFFGFNNNIGTQKVGKIIKAGSIGSPCPFTITAGFNFGSININSLKQAGTSGTGLLNSFTMGARPLTIKNSIFVENVNVDVSDLTISNTYTYGITNVLNVSNNLSLVNNGIGGNTKLTKTGTAISSNGGNTFSGHFNLLNNGAGAVSFGVTTADIFNKSFTCIIGASGGNVTLGYSASSPVTKFNGNVYLNIVSPATAWLTVSNAELKDGMTITTGIPPNGTENPFSLSNPGPTQSGRLIFTNFTQRGLTPQSIVASGITWMLLTNVTFEASSCFEAPSLTLHSGTFTGVAKFRKTAVGSFVTAAGNLTFYSDVYFTVDAGIFSVLENTTDIALFSGNVFVAVASGAIMDLGKAGVAEYKKNLTFNGAGLIRVASAPGGLVNFTGNIDQTISGTGVQFTGCNGTLINLGNATQVNGISGLAINKPAGNVILAMPINLVQTPFTPYTAPKISFIKGNIITTSTNILTLNDNLTYGLDAFNNPYSGSAASFVAGPVKKAGDDAFKFPVGKIAALNVPVYNPVTMTAPANSSAVITAEYFNTAPVTTGTTYLDPLVDVSACEYWNVKSSNAVNLTLSFPWDAASCSHKVQSMALAQLIGTAWNRIGIPTGTVSPLGGIISSTSPVTFTANSSFNFTYGYRSKLTINTVNANAASFNISGAEAIAGPLYSGPSGANNIVSVHPDGESFIYVSIDAGEQNFALNLMIGIDADYRVTTITTGGQNLSTDLYSLSTDKKTIYFKKSKDHIIPITTITTNLANGLVFNPDGGQFSITVPASFGLTSYALRIIDKTNTTVYTTSTTDNTQIKWNGKVSGGSTNHPEGVYRYELDLLKTSSPTQTYSGQMILRAQ